MTIVLKFVGCLVTDIKAFLLIFLIGLISALRRPLLKALLTSIKQSDGVFSGKVL